jgi:hypothetical protein
MSTKRPALNVKQPNRLAESWVSQGTASAADAIPKSQIYEARLTLDITSALRRKIKLAALVRGVTSADLLREVLEREFSNPEEQQP